MRHEVVLRQIFGHLPQPRRHRFVLHVMIACNGYSVAILEILAIGRAEHRARRNKAARCGAFLDRLAEDSCEYSEAELHEATHVAVNLGIDHSRMQ